MGEDSEDEIEKEPEPQEEAQPQPPQNEAGPSNPVVASVTPLRIQDDAANWHFFTTDAMHMDVGWLHYLGASSIKATCKVHKNCACAISLPNQDRAAKMGWEGTYQDIAQDLIKWLDSGLDLTATEHDKAAYVLKANRWFMRVRKPK